ncbi:UAA transporter [Mycena albidolilacea]|uniref:UDP-galactose transporter homolog 1 n=1 Tax=Mycena albidolilacea TaxID=1033008 RepID=A0AAD7F5J1_9AGAR|nr:UAA transporter [Mycena albidolilacea]
MSFIRLALCVAGVYSMFLLWAIAQERLSVPFASIDGSTSDKFKSAIFIGTCQSALSSVSAFVYILLRRKPTDTFAQSLGLEHAPEPVANGKANGHAKHPEKPSVRFSRSNLLLRYLQCAVYITAAAPFGFAALSYISYPAMTLGKSCKLVPVMLMNFLLYRRRFALHKYIVVFMVTLGITIFMGLGDSKKHSDKAKAAVPDNANLIGIAYLLINLALDGAVNSTQDEIFARHRVTGQQMMLWINIFCTALTTVLAALPLPYIPVIHPTEAGSELAAALEFVYTHPSIKMPLLQFAITGAMGQLFIFETLQHFGSLTLVTVTLTRKMFTMLLSVVVYNHKLNAGQWLGAGVVFAGISVEALVKRKDVHAKRVIQEKEVAKIKSL